MYPGRVLQKKHVCAPHVIPVTQGFWMTRLARLQQQLDPCLHSSTNFFPRSLLSDSDPSQLYQNFILQK